MGTKHPATATHECQTCVAIVPHSFAAPLTWPAVRLRRMRRDSTQFRRKQRPQKKSARCPALGITCSTGRERDSENCRSKLRGRPDELNVGVLTFIAARLRYSWHQSVSYKVDRSSSRCVSASALDPRRSEDHRHHLSCWSTNSGSLHSSFSASHPSLLASKAMTHVPRFRKSTHILPDTGSQHGRPCPN